MSEDQELPKRVVSADNDGGANEGHRDASTASRREGANSELANGPSERASVGEEQETPSGAGSPTSEDEAETDADTNPVSDKDELAASGLGDIPPERERVRMGPRRVKGVVSIQDQAVVWINEVGKLVAKLNERHRMDPLPLFLMEVSKTVMAAKRLEPKQLVKLPAGNPARQFFILLSQVAQSIGIEQLPVDYHTLDEWGTMSPEDRTEVIGHLARFTWRYLPGGPSADTIFEGPYSPASIESAMGTIANQLLNLLTVRTRSSAAGGEEVNTRDEGADGAARDQPEVPEE